MIGIEWQFEEVSTTESDCFQIYISRPLLSLSYFTFCNVIVFFILQSEESQYKQKAKL
jgi:hypothetical protein